MATTKTWLNVNDIAVCLPGFKGGGGSHHEPLYGGSGYVEGLINKISETNLEQSSIFIHWEFLNDHGVYARALRRATAEEIIAYNNGITNIHDIPTNNIFKISYLSIDNKIKIEKIEAKSETEALSTLKDLKSVNYVMAE